MFPQPQSRIGVLTDWFAVVCSVLAGCRSGRVRVDGPAALVWTVRRCPGCLASLDDALLALVSSAGSPAGFDLLGRVSDAVRPTDPDAWWLHWIGVHPQRRGRGAGARALTAIVSSARAAGRRLASTTANPLVLPFYARVGLLPLASPVTITDNVDVRYWTLQTTPDATRNE